MVTTRAVNGPVRRSVRSAVSQQRVEPPVRKQRVAAAPMVRAVHTDMLGRRWAVLVPEGRQAEAALGVPVGPPDLSGLGLPEAVMVRLHNELHDRGILTERESRRRVPEVFAALQAAYRVDVAAVVSLYGGGDAQ